MHRSARIYVAGGRTLIGAALVDRLRATGHDNLVGLPPDEPDLTDERQVEDFFAETRPEYVFLAAGKSGGIQLNRTKPAELMRDNLLVATNVLQCAWQHGVRKLLFFGSSCMYPRLAPQPMHETALWTGPLEPTSEAYALAKLAGLELCQAYRGQYGVDFITAIPTNAFGPGDDFDLDSGHVIPALIRKMYEAKLLGDPEVSIWGTGQARREFAFSSDLADACLFVMNHYSEAEPINLGCGEVLSIAEAARTVAEVVGYRGRIVFDERKPDGAPLKALDSSKLRALGWSQTSNFRAGLQKTFEWFLAQHAEKDLCDARTVL